MAHPGEKFYIGTTRFSAKTFDENKKWRTKHNWVGCCYGVNKKVSPTIPPNALIYVLEMNNDTNTINPEKGAHSLSEVARYLKLSENRIRHWEKSYGKILSNNRNQYNHRVFTDSDIKILEKIKLLQDSGLYTKQGILKRIDGKDTIGNNQAQVAPKTDVERKPTKDEIEYRQKLLAALNTLAAEIKSLRREVREDLQGSLRSEIEHLSFLLFPPKAEKKPWWKFWQE